jgi:hypothetical protein
MPYIRSEEHFINICCKRLRDFGIIFSNQEQFVQNLSQIYQRSEETQHLLKHSLIDTITWYLYQRNKKEEIIEFFCKEMKEIFSEVLRLNDAETEEENFEYIRPIKKSGRIEYIEIQINGEYKTISDEAIQELEKLYNCYGIYFIYNNKDQLLYIGKSKNLANRIPESIKERNGAKFAYILTTQPSDIHILEPYLILKHKPIKNTQFMEFGDTSFDISSPALSKIIPFYEENEKENTI